MALIGMGGQLMLGFMTLNNGPLRQQARLDGRVLAICAVVVCTAALIKFQFYLQFIASAGGHSEIYTEGDALRDNSPAAIRILAAGAPLIGLLALTQPGLPKWCRALGALSIVLEFAIGIRSRPLFILMGAIALFQARVRLTRLLKVLIVAGAVVAVVAIAAIGYFRENNSVTAAEFSGWSSRACSESSKPAFSASKSQIPAQIVVTQIVPLLAPTPIGSIDTVGKLLTSTFTPQAYLAGYGYSSAALTEITMLVGPVWAALIYPLAVFAIVTAIKAAITSRRSWTFLYGASTLPIAYYIWRAELWQMVVPAIKAAPFILVLLAADAFARLGQRRSRRAIDFGRGAAHLVTARSRILILTPRFPYPVVGGDRLRIHAICRVLAKEHSLTLLSLCETRDEFDPALVADGVFDRVERVLLPRWRSLAQVVAALPGRTPLQVAYYRSRAFADAVARLAPEHDLVFAHLIRTGDYLLGGSRGPTMLEMTDAISMNYDRVRRQGGAGLRGRVYAVEQARLLAYERRMPEAFSAVSLIAEADARYLWGERMPGNVVIASNGVDPKRLPFVDRGEANRVAVFIGNIHSAQNMDACRHFVTDVMPLLSETDLAEFRVVGRIREADAAWLRAHPRVTVTGEVASIPEAVRDARIGVCPVRIGAGVQNKVLEYLALGLPTVCSPVGHEGIDAVAGEDLLVAAGPTAFAAQIRRLNDDPLLYGRLAERGRRFVETRHGWDAALEPVAAAVRDAIATSRRTRSA